MKRHATTAYTSRIVILDHGIRHCFGSACKHSIQFVPGNVRHGRSIPTSRVAQGCNLIGSKCILFLNHVIPRGNIRCLVRTFGRLSASGGLIVTNKSSSSTRCCRRVRSTTTASPHVILANFVRNRRLTRLCDGTCVCILPDSLRNVPVDLLRTVDCNGYYLASSVPRYTRMMRSCTIAFRGDSVTSLATGLDGLLTSSSHITRLRTATTGCVARGCG